MHHSEVLVAMLRMRYTGEDIRPNARADRGLLLIPAYVCVGVPIALFDPTFSRVLIYAARCHSDRFPGCDSTPSVPLTALIGATRAAILDSIGTRHPITTTELSRHAAISMASASEHATILRNAGLITSHRDRNRMFHQPTPLGHALLTGSKRSQIPVSRI